MLGPLIVDRMLELAGIKRFQAGPEKKRLLAVGSILAMPPFKCRDYYEGTGRAHDESAAIVQDAIEMGGEPLPDWDPEPLLKAFPDDLWTESFQRARPLVRRL